MMLAAAALALPLSAAQPAKKTAKVKKQNKKEVKASRKWNHEQVVRSEEHTSELHHKTLSRMPSSA